RLTCTCCALFAGSVIWASRWHRSVGFWASRRDRSRQNAEVKRVATAHMNELREKINSLEQIANTLQTLIECCSGDDRPDCPILVDSRTQPIDSSPPIHHQELKASAATVMTEEDRSQKRDMVDELFQHALMGS